MTNQLLTKLPLRVYTPIEALAYNKDVTDDIKETADMLNISTAPLNDLAPVVFQTHEPSESQRVVAWVKPEAEIEFTVGDEEPETVKKAKGVYIYCNGVWQNIIPIFEEVADKEEDIENIRQSIEESYLPAVEQLLEDIENATSETEALYDQTIQHTIDSRNAYVRSLQHAAATPMLTGFSAANVPPNAGGRFNPSSVPNGHVQVNFVTGEGFMLKGMLNPYADQPQTDGPPIEPKRIVNEGAHLYRAFNMPVHDYQYVYQVINEDADDPADRIVNEIYRPGWDEKTLPDGGIIASYRLDWRRWNGYRQNVLSYREQQGLPEVEYPGYSPDAFAINFGFKSQGDGVEDPFVGITLTSEDAVWVKDDLIIPIVELMKGHDAETNQHYVLGFKVWFALYTPQGNSWIASPRGGNISFMWVAHGKRKNPPVFDTWGENIII
jgi:hypothetical protein